MEDNLTSRNEDNLLWRYFTLFNRFHEKCKLCGKYISNRILQILTCHLQTMHLQEIQEVREEIRHTWLWQYFTFNQSTNMSIRCIYYKRQFSIFSGVNILRVYYFWHGINKYSRNYLCMQRNNMNSISHQ